MLKRLRWKLTFTYFFATLALVILIGGGSYYVLESYLRSEVDLALGHGMAYQFQLFGIDLPSSLEGAEQAWVIQQDRLTFNPDPINGAVSQTAQRDDDDDEEEEDYAEHEESESELEELAEHGYGSQLISVFTMPLNDYGDLIFNPNPYPLPMSPELAAFQSALTNGSDIRTVSLPNGERVRLLTYPTGSQNGQAAFQLGRMMVEQDRALRQLLFGVITIGSISLLIVGLGSWRLAGRSLLPAQRGLDQQQAFVANASHELRTPLTLIRASTEMALRKNSNQAISDLLQNVIEEADYMSLLVNDLLLLTRLDAEQIKLELTDVKINELLTEAASQIEKLAEKKQIRIETDPVSGVLLADLTRMRQVLLIILDNAINHTPKGGKIDLRARKQERQLVIEIQDNGVGIGPEHLPHIFERFYQAEVNENSDHRSNGLGLSIAKTLIELHHGQITASSVPGKGTTITITLPSLPIPR